MPAQETQQPQVQQMELPTMENGAAVETQQPTATEKMTAEPVSMRGGGGADAQDSLASSVSIAAVKHPAKYYILNVRARTSMKYERTWQRTRQLDMGNAYTRCDGL
ncbi:hypothetical protein HYFRA_00005332 [Hymenoscyphus fraxineus]|uniref:Uncharacterized protein n=1 Tax=Hymenoscyphus fraxineus TaxID=746836 RepID=A0A9N9LF40_9HELO|nr:hypothetical protein HYFRA_00005332 [Hymenoscyphus fraxineus]